MDATRFEEIFLSSLGSIEKLKWYLENNIDVINYLQQTQSKYLFGADVLMSFIPKKRKKEIAEKFNQQRILYLIQINRPDLYPIMLKYPNSSIWLNQQIEFFKKRFL